MAEGEVSTDVAARTDVALTVAAVARRLGVAPATLRTWDRRYGLGPSAHVAGTHRRYNSEDLARLSAMRRLVLDGVAPAEAARVVIEASSDNGAALASLLGQARLDPHLNADFGDSDFAEEGALAKTVPLRPLSGEGTGSADAVAVAGSADAGSADTAEVDSGDAAGAAPDEEADTPSAPTALRDTGRRGSRTEGGRAGGGRVIALPSGTQAARGLARAAMALDAAECSRIVRDALRRHGVLATWHDLCAPVLVGIGDRWEATGEGIEVEHLLSEVLLAALRGVALGVGTAVNTRPVLLACAEEEQHTLAMHVIGAALAERHVASRMLGARLPAYALADAVRRSGPLAVVVWSQMPATASVESFSLIPAVRPAPFLLAAGEGWADVPLPREVRYVRDPAELVQRIAAAAGAASLTP